MKPYSIYPMYVILIILEDMHLSIIEEGHSSVGRAPAWHAGGQ